MNNLPKTLLFSFTGLSGFAVIVTLLNMTVVYHPVGVKPHQRQAYKEKMQKLEELQRISLQADAATKPVASFASIRFDFGMVDPHTTMTHDFEVQNEGELPLTLGVVDTSCKCTLGELKNNTLLPGEKTVVTLRWNTGYKEEHYRQTATLATNDPLRQQVELAVSGTVKAKFIAPQQISFRTTDAGELTKTSFVVYSQLWDDFTITDIQSDVDGFEWYAAPEQLDAAELLDSQAASAWRVHVLAAPLEYGKYEGTVEVKVEPAGGVEQILHRVACEGKVRKPINFYHPDIHQTLGLDLGTLVAGKAHEVHLIVRARVDSERALEVLDVEPKGLEALLEPLKDAGSYRLTVRVPEDCPMVVFNANQKHGFVQVGDPKNKDFSNWFPLMGAVVKLD